VAGALAGVAGFSLEVTQPLGPALLASGLALIFDAALAAAQNPRTLLLVAACTGVGGLAIEHLAAKVAILWTIPDLRKCLTRELERLAGWGLKGMQSAATDLNTAIV